MKSFFTLIGLTLISLGLNAQIFVNGQATGNKTGNSWADAFTSLSAAIDAAPAGSQVWVAAGTYLPGSNPGATFNMTKNLQLYGGFDGTETMLSQRNDSINITILSGDIDGDDLPGNVQSNKSDNSRHIMMMSSAISNATRIEGFIFQGGYADTTGQYTAAEGGAIFSLGAPIIKRCKFIGNFAAAGGGAIYLGDITASGAQLELCQFIGNRSDNLGGAVYMGNMTGPNTLVKDCLFRGNIATNKGGGLRSYNTSLTVFNSHFANNQADIIGGGIGILQSPGSNSLAVRVQACSFDRNISSKGGGLALVANGSNYSLEVNNSQFTHNASQALTTVPLYSGGGMDVFTATTASQGSISCTNSNFEDNSSEVVGGGIHIYSTGTTCSVQVANCQFLRNQITTQDFGTGAAMAIGVPGEQCDVNVQQSLFQDNSGGQGGALTISAQDAGLDCRVSRCDFIGNQAEQFGTAMFVNANCLVEYSTFENNHPLPSENPSYVAAIGISPTFDSMQVLVTHADFRSNKNADGGAAIEVFRFPGAGLPQGADIAIENSLIAQHDSGQAAIKVQSVPITLSNLTIAANDMSALQAANGGTIKLRNSILSSPGHDDIIIDMGSTFSSLGGNLISDSSADQHLTAMDISAVDPAFEDRGSEPFQLAFGSPAVDLGQTYAGFDATSLDLAGNLRLQGSKPDAGTYESPFFTSIKNQLDESVNLRMYPNPVVKQARIELDNSWHGLIKLKVYNALGQIIYHDDLRKNAQQSSWSIDLGWLESGQYQLLLSDGTKHIHKTFLKVRD